MELEHLFFDPRRPIPGTILVNWEVLEEDDVSAVFGFEDQETLTYPFHSGLLLDEAQVIDSLRNSQIAVDHRSLQQREEDQIRDSEVQFHFQVEIVVGTVY